VVAVVFITLLVELAVLVAGVLEFLGQEQLLLDQLILVAVVLVDCYQDQVFLLILIPSTQ
jgi:hypothetical protein